jgi:hypothetical protein
MMLYLAQVQVKEQTGQVEVWLLAQQTSEYAWALLAEQKRSLVVSASEWASQMSSNDLLGVGRLLLVQVSESGQLEGIDDATPWVLNLIQVYLVSGLSPHFLRQEAERAEQWRQALTLQNQELGRQRLELEARREQIQTMEESLKQERLRLELLASQLQQLLSASAPIPLQSEESLPE